LVAAVWALLSALPPASLGLPDIGWPCGINGLSPKCRVCRVLISGESPRDFTSKTCACPPGGYLPQPGKTLNRKSRRSHTQPASILDFSWTPNGGPRKARGL
jgi:hypothetical protein